MTPTRITDIKTFITKPDKHNLVVVKVETDQGVFGLGCATFQFRPSAVKVAVDDYLRPLLVGRNANEIEDLWNVMRFNAYWRNGPVLNNAIAGVDMALWDIKGKLARMPLYQLLGGRARTAIPAYAHAVADDADALCEQIEAYRQQGYRYVRVQLGFYGGNSAVDILPDGALAGAYFDAERYAAAHIGLFKEIRDRFGDSVQMLHDVHERLTPAQAIRFAKDAEPFHLFFLEDVMPLEDNRWLDRLRAQTSTPIAVGELFNNPAEWTDIIRNRLVDYLRIHVSQIGGITPALKVAHFAAALGVKIAWHTPSDISPIGLAVNTHLNIHLSNAAIQENIDIPKRTLRVFGNVPSVHNGYFHPIEHDGIGVTFDEGQADLFRGQFKEHPWTLSRTSDGTCVAP